MKRLTMRKIKEAMRLQASGLSTRKIAASLGVGHSVAADYMKQPSRIKSVASELFKPD